MVSSLGSTPASRHPLVLNCLIPEDAERGVASAAEKGGPLCKYSTKFHLYRIGRYSACNLAIATYSFSLSALCRREEPRRSIFLYNLTFSSVDHPEPCTPTSNHAHFIPTRWCGCPIAKTNLNVSVLKKKN